MGTLPDVSEGHFFCSFGYALGPMPEYILKIRTVLHDTPRWSFWVEQSWVGSFFIHEQKCRWTLVTVTQQHWTTWIRLIIEQGVDLNLGASSSGLLYFLGDNIYERFVYELLTHPCGRCHLRPAVQAVAEHSFIHSHSIAGRLFNFCPASVSAIQQWSSHSIPPTEHTPLAISGSCGSLLTIPHSLIVTRSGAGYLDVPNGTPTPSPLESTHARNERTMKTLQMQLINVYELITRRHHQLQTLERQAKGYNKRDTFCPLE